MRATSILLIAFLASTSAALAQSFSGTSTTTAEYKPLTFWNRLTLGSTFFTNSTVASSIKVVYSFNLDDLSSKAKEADLTALAKKGEISFGIFDKTSNTIKSVPASAATISELKKNYPDENLVVLSSGNTLLGGKPSGTFFTFRDSDTTFISRDERKVQ